MSWIIIKQPHPLDRIWRDAVEAVHQADVAMDELGSDFTDEQLDVAGDARLDAILTVIALPARNLSDTLYKLDLSGLGNSVSIAGIDQNAILREGLALIEHAVSRGAKLKPANPDLLEEVIP